MSRYIQRALLLGLITCLLGLTNSYAEQNTLRAVDISRHGEQVFIRLKLDKSLAKAPTSFATLAPARIVVDLPDTTNATATVRKTVDMGEIRHIDIVQAGTRTRIVINLKRPVNHTTQLVDQEAQVLIGGATQPVASTTSSTNKAASLALERNAVLDIDFRRGDDGAGRVIIDLAREQSAIDVRRQGQGIVIDLMKSTLPDLLKRRLDVKDFATPVQEIGASSTGDMVRITVTAGGQWDHIAWQTERRLVVEVKPQKTTERGNGRGYRGEKLSLNFQNIEVRALLQVIADFTGLNVVASDTVGGNLTLRLKDVPWDQALDIVMQARGLDMRKSGNVLWIAPKDELLTKERLELEQRAQINELEPLVTETFQLNYQKAEAFQKVFGLDGQAGRGSILSRRGSASAEPRSNKLFITDTPGKLEEVRRLIQMTDVPQRQVMIEARIVEADDSFNKNLGARLGYADYNRDGKGPVGINLPGSTRLGVTGNYLGVGEQTGQAAVTGGSYMPNTQFVDLPAGKIGTASPGSIGFSLFSAGANRFLNLELTALQADGKGAAHGAHELLQDQADAPGGQQRFQGPAVEAADHRLLQQQARQAAHQEGQGDRHQDVDREQRIRQHRLEDVLHHEGGVGTEHHQLAVGHVDDTHQPEDHRQAQCRQHQNRADGHAVEECVVEKIHRDQLGSQAKRKERRGKQKGGDLS
ncbi:MAG: hypothetical protein RLZ64_540, partial [Pseudomonadota bacterium]